MVTKTVMFSFSGVNERLRSEQVLSKPVEAAVVKGFVDMAVDTSKKEAKEIVVRILIM